MLVVGHRCVLSASITHTCVKPSQRIGIYIYARAVFVDVAKVFSQRVRHMLRSAFRCLRMKWLLGYICTRSESWPHTNSIKLMSTQSVYIPPSELIHVRLQPTYMYMYHVYTHECQDNDYDVRKLYSDGFGMLMHKVALTNLISLLRSIVFESTLSSHLVFTPLSIDCPLADEEKNQSTPQ